MDQSLSKVTLGRTLHTERAAGVLVHDSVYGANAWMPRHSHASASVTVVLCGEQLDMVERVASRCVGLMVIVKPSGLVHETECGPAGCRSATVEVPARLEGMLKRRFGLFERCAHLDDAVAAKAVLRVWSATRDTDDPVRLEEVWLGAAGEIALACRTEAGRNARPGGMEAHAMALMERGLTVSEVAGQLRVHPVHLCRVMKRATGRGTVQNLRRMRVRRGIDRVLSGASLATAAIEAGFADQSHLTREMVREIGMTPARFCRAADV